LGGRAPQTPHGACSSPPSAGRFFVYQRSSDLLASSGPWPGFLCFGAKPQSALAQQGSALSVLTLGRPGQRLITYGQGPQKARRTTDQSQRPLGVCDLPSAGRPRVRTRARNHPQTKPPLPLGGQPVRRGQVLQSHRRHR
jgi:hypothetical protein